MRNYPLLTNKNKAPTPTNWQKTYVSSLVMQTKSLVDYSNYFLTDYRRGPDPSFLGEGVYKQGTSGDKYKCYSIEALRYHQYTDTIEEALYFLRNEDYNDARDESFDPFDSRYCKIRAGRHLINNNQRESNINTYKDWENIAIQPMGYAAFYLISFIDGILTFNFTKNAQLYYGDNSPLAILDFYTRFFYKNNEGAYIFSNLNLQFKTVDILSERDGSPVIVDKQGFTWIDRKDNPVMGFSYIKTGNDTSLGEEFIADTKISYPIRVDKVGVAAYTMTANGDLASGADYYWPVGSRVYFL